MIINERFFGVSKSEKRVNEYVLSNDSGAYVSIINLGAIISRVMVPDKKGKLQNVVFGFNNLEDYEERNQFFGTVVGRYAGRISYGKFSIDSNEYSLAQNDGNNNLHSGPNGFETEVFECIEKKSDSDKCTLKLKLIHPDGKRGFPGNLTTYVTYMWNNENQLTMKFEAITDQDTLINLTNHSYFNLSGDLSTDIHDHILYLDSDKFLNFDEDTNHKNFVPVIDTPFDFTEPKKVGKDINENYSPLLQTGGYDHPFSLNNPGLENTQIKLKEPKSGRILEMSTDNEAVVFYAGNQLVPGFKIYDGVPIKKRGALCLETEYFPNDINSDLVDTKTILRKNEKYEKTTIYKFLTE